MSIYLQPILMRVSSGGVAYGVAYSGDAPFLVGNVTCSGEETSLEQCQYIEVGKSRLECSSLDLAAGVLCFNSTG